MYNNNKKGLVSVIVLLRTLLYIFRVRKSLPFCLQWGVHALRTFPPFPMAVLGALPLFPLQGFRARPRGLATFLLRKWVEAGSSGQTAHECPSGTPNTGDPGPRVQLGRDRLERR